MPALESFMYIEAIFNLYSISVCELAKPKLKKKGQIKIRLLQKVFKKGKKAWSIAQGSPFES
jgi:hypothetical protein